MEKVHLIDINVPEFQEEWKEIAEFPGLMVKNYVTSQDKLEIASSVADLLGVDDTNAFNYIKFKIICDIESIARLTNIELGEEDLQDYGMLHDRLDQCGLIDKFYDATQSDDDRNACWYGDIEQVVCDLYTYNNSAYGVMEGIVGKYKDTELDVEKITEELKDPGSIPLLKDIIDKLG